MMTTTTTTGEQKCLKLSLDRHSSRDRVAGDGGRHNGKGVLDCSWIGVVEEEYFSGCVKVKFGCAIVELR